MELRNCLWLAQHVLEELKVLRSLLVIFSNWPYLSHICPIFSIYLTIVTQKPNPTVISWDGAFSHQRSQVREASLKEFPAAWWFFFQVSVLGGATPSGAQNHFGYENWEFWDGIRLRSSKLEKNTHEPKLSLGSFQHLPSDGANILTGQPFETHVMLKFGEWICLT